ncbi:MAG: tRNA (adenosine(37)-N6)-threonylcarbamoyltransferase complex dimerization subunit type 1 TsaB [Paludibacteraceae bacterium]
MATILHIETSTTVCSAALSYDGRLGMSRVCATGMSHASKLPVFIDEILQECRRRNLQCDAVAVSAGPGSYTGLRIGVSTAKGICYGLNAKLLAIDTLQLIARAALPKIADENALICPMIDARRMEVYTALYDTKLQKILDCTAKIIDADAFSDILSTRKIYFCGDGAAKCQAVITHANAVFLDGIVPLADNMLLPAEAQYAACAFEDVAYFEPLYLKEFQTTKPKTMNL